MLRRLGATSPDKAQRLDTLNPRDRKRLDRLMAKGVIRERAPGEYYYDLAAERAARNKLIPWLLAIAAALAVVALLLAFYNSRHVEALP